MTDKQQRREAGSRAGFRFAVTALTIVGMLSIPSVLLAQKGSGGGKSSGDSKQDKEDQKNAEKPKCPEIVGNHALLEKMAGDYGLSCPQEDKIEPMLHDEESVSKPLMMFSNTFDRTS